MSFVKVEQVTTHLGLDRSVAETSRGLNTVSDPSALGVGSPLSGGANEHRYETENDTVVSVSNLADGSDHQPIQGTAARPEGAL